MSNQPTNNAGWSRRWQMWLKHLGLDITSDGGVRGCRVKRMEVSPGLIQAQVQDRELGAAAVEIRLPVLDDAQWERIISALGSQAIYAAQLLAGNMPPEIESMFAEAGASLLPESLDELRQTCSACPPGAKPCRPLSAVYWQLGEMLGEDPWLLLRLRGRDRQQVLSSIHERRNLGAEPAARPSTPVPQPLEADTASFYSPSPTASLPDDSVPPLEDQIGDYWGRRKVLEEIHHHLSRPVVELALLRRLGPPTPTPDGQDAYGQLQTVYRRVTERVWALAFDAGSDRHGGYRNSNGDPDGDVDEDRDEEAAANGGGTGGDYGLTPGAPRTQPHHRPLK
jgi:uncharacterized Zn finger protein